MVCIFIDTLCKYTTCIMRSLRQSSCCYWLAVDCGGRATFTWSRLMAFLLGRLLGVLLFTGARSMGRAVQWSPMKPESELIRLVEAHLSLRRPASIAGYIAIYRTCCANMRTALFDVSVLTGPSHLAYWAKLICIISLTVRVRVTLRLTVCQSVSLGVEPTLGLTTRCYFPLEV
jgi:hypothetical protein